MSRTYPSACLAGVLIAASTLVAGCSSDRSRSHAATPANATSTATTTSNSSRSSGSSASSAATEAQTHELVQQSTLVSQGSLMPLLIAMEQIEPGSFTGSGSTSTPQPQGAIELDFDNGNGFGQPGTVDSVILSGRMRIEWSGGGGAATIVITYLDFTTTDTTGTTVLDGTLSLTVAYSGPLATIRTVGDYSVTADGSTSTIAQDTRTDYDALSGRAVIDGSISVSNDALGTWAVTMTALRFERDASSGELTIEAGTSTLDRPQVGFRAVYVFTGNNAGTYAHSPGGSGPFQL